MAADTGQKDQLSTSAKINEAQLSVRLAQLTADFQNETAAWSNSQQSTNLFLEWDDDHTDTDLLSHRPQPWSARNSSAFGDHNPEMDPITQFIARLWTSYSAR